MVIGDVTNTKVFYFSDDFGSTWTEIDAPASFPTTVIRGVSVTERF